MEQPSGLAFTGDSIEPDQFLHWLRTLPTGTGVSEFERVLASGELAAAVQRAATKPPYHDPDYEDQELDASLELVAQLQRVAPDSAGPSEFFLQFPRDTQHALEVLRRLPDGAGLHAVVKALNDSADAEGENS